MWGGRGVGLAFSINPPPTSAQGHSSRGTPRRPSASQPASALLTTPASLTGASHSEDQQLPHLSMRHFHSWGSAGDKICVSVHTWLVFVGVTTSDLRLSACFGLTSSFTLKSQILPRPIHKPPLAFCPGWGSQALVREELEILESRL